MTDQTTKPVQLRTLAVQCHEETVGVLSDLLRRAQAGEIVAVTGVMEFPSGTYTTFGGSTMSRLQTAGALLEAAVIRLGFEAK